MSQVSERQNVTELAELYDLEQLRQLKYRYLRHLDLKEWDQLERLFTPDATATYADGAYACNSRDQIIEFLREVLGPSMVTMHQCHHPELKVRGNRAIGRWYLQDTVHMMEHRLTLEGSAFYEDRYLRIGIESPCIEGHYQLDLDYVGATGAFRQEAGPADAWYKEGYGLTWTPAEGSRSWF